MVIVTLNNYSFIFQLNDKGKASFVLSSVTLNNRTHSDRYGNSLASVRPALPLLRQTKPYHSRRWLVERIERLTPTALPLAEGPVNQVCRKKKKCLKCKTLNRHRTREGSDASWNDVTERTLTDDFGCIWAVMVARTRFVSTGDWFLWMGISSQAEDIWFIFIIWLI